MQPQQSASKTSLPTIQDHKFLRDEVTRLIRNKIEPLSFKQYVLKSGRYKIKQPQQNNTMTISLNKSIQIIESRTERFISQKQNIGNQKKREKSGKNKKNNLSKRRKGIVQLGQFVLDKKRLKQLQEKVERHVILKKMDLMENEYSYAEECNKKVKEEVCNKLNTSPLQKYLEMFQQNEKPSQKIKRGEQVTCQQMLKQIKSAKSIKHIQIIQHNMRNLININGNTNVQESHIDSQLSSLSAFDPMPADSVQFFSRKQLTKQKPKSKKMLKLGTQIAYTEQNVKKHNNKLRKQIMNDIKKQYENQGNPKIRMSINHRKMIQLT